jgi:mercuric ion binding protein
MTRRFFSYLLLAALVASDSAVAGERSVTLAVENMYCALCPITVRRAIEAVPGVAAVEVVLETKTAVVTFDDAESSVEALVAASTNAGYPARLAE